MPTAEAIVAEETLIPVLWINAGLSCDGDSVSLTAATQPSIEEIALGALPGLPKVDEALRPTWLFGATVHEGCDRAGYYEQADFADEYGSPKCIVKLGCWGPVVKCNVPKRG